MKQQESSAVFETDYPGEESSINNANFLLGGQLAPKEILESFQNFPWNQCDIQTVSEAYWRGGLLYLHNEWVLL